MSNNRLSDVFSQKYMELFGLPEEEKAARHMYDMKGWAGWGKSMPEEFAVLSEKIFIRVLYSPFTTILFTQKNLSVMLQYCGRDCPWRVPAFYWRGSKNVFEQERCFL